MQLGFLIDKHGLEEVLDRIAENVHCDYSLRQNEFVAEEYQSLNKMLEELVNQALIIKEMVEEQKLK